MEISRNVAPTQRFNPPVQHECFMDGKPAGPCFVYDGPAWRNKNRPTAQRPTNEPHPLKGKISA